VAVAHGDDGDAGGLFQHHRLVGAHGVALGQPAHLGQRHLAVAHRFQLVVPGAAAPAQNGAAGAHGVQPGVFVVQQGKGAGGVDKPRLKPGGADGVQHLLELLQLLRGGGVVGLGGVELGVNAAQGHVGQRAVGQQQLLRLGGEESAKAQPGVHLNVGLGDGGAVLRQGVERHAGVHRGDGADHVQVQQPLQLLPVGGGAQHQDLLVHKAGLAQLFGLCHITDGEMADALVPQQLGQRDKARPAPVAGEHGVDHGAFGVLFDDGEVVLECGLLNDQLAHGKRSLLFVRQSRRA